MVTFLAIIHIIACLGLIGLVLIQDSKGGGVFTSQTSSNSVLGATGATSLAQTMTKVVATVFAVTCIGLSIMSARADRSVVDGGSVIPTVPAQTTPATTETAPANSTTETAPAPTQPAANEKK